MNLSLLTTIITLLFTLSNERGEYHGKYEYCDIKSPKQIGPQLILSEEKHFTFEITYIFWYAHYEKVTGKYEIKDDRIEFYPDEVIYNKGYKNSGHMDIYLKENNVKNRRNDKKKYGKKTKKKWRREYHDFDEIEAKFYEEKWRYLKPVFKINQDGHGIELLALDSNSIKTNFDLPIKFCKHKDNDE